MAILPESILSQIHEWLICLKNADPAERLEAATALRDLVRAQRNASTVRTRGSLAHTAARRVTPELEKHIVAGIWDKHREVRNTMAQVVGELCGPDVVADLIAIAQGDSDWQVREAVAEALTAIGGPKAGHALAEIARDDPHPGPVARAAQGLEALVEAVEPPTTLAGAVRTRGALAALTRATTDSGPSSALADALEALNQLQRHADPTVRAAVERAVGGETPGLTGGR
jgi:HEAT repeat protein